VLVGLRKIDLGYIEVVASGCPLSCGWSVLYVVVSVCYDIDCRFAQILISGIDRRIALFGHSVHVLIRYIRLIPHCLRDVTVSHTARARVCVCLCLN